MTIGMPIGVAGDMPLLIVRPVAEVHITAPMLNGIQVLAGTRKIGMTHSFAYMLSSKYMSKQFHVYVLTIFDSSITIRDVAIFHRKRLSSLHVKFAGNAFLGSMNGIGRRCQSFASIS